MTTDTSAEVLEQIDAKRLVQRIPMLRWGQIVRRYGIDLQEIEAPENLPYLMIVIANEMQRVSTGRDQFEQFEQMGMIELSDFIGSHSTALDPEAEIEADEADKSGASV